MRSPAICRLGRISAYCGALYSLSVKREWLVRYAYVLKRLVVTLPRLHRIGYDKYSFSCTIAVVPCCLCVQSACHPLCHASNAAINQYNAKSSILACAASSWLAPCDSDATTAILQVDSNTVVRRKKSRSQSLCRPSPGQRPVACECIWVACVHKCQTTLLTSLRPSEIPVCQDGRLHRDSLRRLTYATIKKATQTTVWLRLVGGSINRCVPARKVVMFFVHEPLYYG